MSQIARGREERISADVLRVTRTSSFTGRVHSMDLPVKEHEWHAWRCGGALIQNAMPGLAPHEREFIMTGATREEWDAVFNDSSKREETT